MCGRFAGADLKAYEQYVALLMLGRREAAEEWKREYRQRFNIAPTQSVHVVDQERREDVVRWGFAPTWAAPATTSRPAPPAATPGHASHRRAPRAAASDPPGGRR